ncbi:Uncharacterised protein [Pseudomonas aeruginosa]|nr:Uncharacterised protein [Pseudomonas aeruginosa]
MVAALLADQQVQVRLGHAGDQLCPFQGETFQLVRFNHHEDAANGLHDRLPEWLVVIAETTLDAIQPLLLMHIKRVGLPDRRSFRIMLRLSCPDQRHGRPFPE